jgi:hypothetical protein
MRPPDLFTMKRWRNPIDWNGVRRGVGEELGGVVGQRMVVLAAPGVVAAGVVP